MNEHNMMLDEAAMMALDALSTERVAEVRAHIATCETCAAEYHRFKAVAGVLSLAAADPQALQNAPGPALKRRVFAAIHGPSFTRASGIAPVLFVAAALILAVIFGALYENESSQVRDQNSLIADLAAPASERYLVETGEVLRNGAHVYLVLRNLPSAPAGKIYQAWTLPSGSKRMKPSVTFSPRAGLVLLRLPVDAKDIAVVAVTIEPAGGSPQPTSKPVFLVTLRT